MHPSDLRSLRGYLDSIRAELAALRKLLQEQLDSIHHTQERQRQEQESQNKVQVEIATCISDLRPTENEKSEQRSQNNKALTIQFILMLGTLGAFIAAAIYAGIASSELSQMKVAAGQAKRSADIAEESLESVQRAFLSFAGAETGNIDEFKGGQIAPSMRVFADWQNVGNTRAMSVYDDVGGGKAIPTEEQFIGQPHKGFYINAKALPTKIGAFEESLIWFFGRNLAWLAWLDRRCVLIRQYPPQKP